MKYIANSNRYDHMEYNKCGESGLKLPAVSLGLWHNFGDNGNYDKIYKAVSSFDAPNIYYGIWQDEDGKRCIVFMEMIPKSLKMARSYNHSTVLTKLTVRGEDSEAE